MKISLNPFLITSAPPNQITKNLSPPKILIKDSHVPISKNMISKASRKPKKYRTKIKGTPTLDSSFSSSSCRRLKKVKLVQLCCKVAKLELFFDH